MSHIFPTCETKPLIEGPDQLVFTRELNLSVRWHKGKMNGGVHGRGHMYLVEKKFIIIVHSWVGEDQSYSYFSRAQPLS